MSKNKFNNSNTQAKAAAAPAAEVKTETAAAVAADTQDTAPAKKKPGRKPGSKSATKAVKKEPAKTEIRLQLHGNDLSLTDLEDRVKAQFVAEGHRAGCIKDLTIYAKPEENKAYYVINEGKFTGDINLY